MSRDEWLALPKMVYEACTKDEQQRVNEKAVVDGLNKLLPKPPEGQAGFPGFGPANWMAGPIVKRADSDKDGKATLDEMMAAANKLFEEFDKEKTGKLDEDAFGAMLNALFQMPGWGQPPQQPPRQNEVKKEEKPPPN